VSRSPSRAVPPIAGAAVLTGAPATTTAVSPDVAPADPPPFAAVTTTRIVWPTSPGASS
jgi:hypothetical protein